MFRYLRVLLLALIPFLGGCYTVQVPLNDQGALDRVGLVLPDTRFPSGSMERTLVPLLESRGFRWNDPRYSLGHHMIRGNRLVLVMPDGTVEVRRYVARFRDSGFRITHFQPTPSGDLGKNGDSVTPSLFHCLYNRPAAAFEDHAHVSFATLLADGVFTGGIDTALFPFTIVLCETVNRLPLSYLSLEISRDGTLTRFLNDAWAKARLSSGSGRSERETDPDERYDPRLR